MPTTLTRSLVTILVPGLVAVAPWLLSIVLFTKATLGFDQYPTLAHAMLFALVVVVGSLFQGLGSYIEHRWDKSRNEAGECDVYGDWYAYLASVESPVGHRYLSRLVTSLYFELTMLFAAPVFFVGTGLLVILRFPEHAICAAAGALLASVLAVLYFRWQAYDTHGALCTTRSKIRRKAE